VNRQKEVYVSGGDLIGFAGVCTQWRRAWLRSPNRQSAFEIYPTQFSRVVQSSMRRHIASLRATVESVPQWLLFSTQLPDLRQLTLDFKDGGVLSSVLEDVSLKAKFINSAIPINLRSLTVVST
jgi:hypothetical protein